VRPVQDAQDRVCIRFAQRHLDDGGPLMPLPKETAPGRLGPAGVSDGPVPVPRTEVMPEPSGRDVAQAVGGGVQDHLGMADRAAGEVEKHWVMARGRGFRRLAVARAVQKLLEVMPALCPTPGDAMGEGGGGMLDPLYLFRAGPICDDGYRARLVEPVGDVPGGQLVGPGHGHRPDPDCSKESGVPGGNPREHHEHRVALLYSQAGQGPGRPAGLERQIGHGLLGHGLALAVQ
jgi:hypothetical protein